MLRVPATFLLALVLIPACTRPPTIPASTASTPSTVSSPLGHFRLKLLITHDITPSKSPAGAAIIKLKSYPPIIAAQADFYLPDGPTSQAIATLPDGHLLLLQFTDLKLSPDQADARQYHFDANFQIQSALGRSSAWPYSLTNSSPPPIFQKDQPRSGILSGFANVLNNIQMNATDEYELTYLGLTSASDLMQKSNPPALINIIPPDFSEKIQADARALALTTLPRP